MAGSCALTENCGMNERKLQTEFSRSHSQTDVSVQADLLGYDSEDERTGRGSKRKRGTPYSKVDIREQYCINKKEVQVLESQTSALFGCLSKHHGSSCNSRQSFLSVCMGKVPSDENLHDVRRQSLPRRPVEDLERAYLRRRPKSLCSVDPGRYDWIPEDEESLNLEHVRSLYNDTDSLGMRRGYTISFSSEHLPTSCPAHYLPPPPPPPLGSYRSKHVCFSRSRTLTSLDDAMIELRKSPQMYKSQERLILSAHNPRKGFCSMSEKKKTPMKTQATQTGCIGREPPTYLSLSPRTVHRVRMVSQGAQTNGQAWNGRRLMKSYSEAGYHFGEDQSLEKSKEHEALTRTQSEEPRSPYMKQNLLPWPDVEEPDERKKIRTSRIYKEILIDFQPVESKERFRHRFVEEELPGGQTMDMDSDDQIVDRVDGVKVSLTSFSENDIPNGCQADQSHPFPQTQDSIDEEFHENLVYRGIFNKFSASEQSLKVAEKETREKVSGASTPDNREVLPMATLNISRRTSPFASSDSLANDQKDHSDGIWNESQSTVLQAEFDNGETSSRTSSKKHLLLLQHQQRSSMDTEILESDVLHSQSPVYSPINQESAVPFVTVASVHQNGSPTSVSVGEMTQTEYKTSAHNLVPNVYYGTSKENRRKLSKSPEKDETRVDSGKATDISETSTTEDYATAYDNSGTDTSSKKSTGHQALESKTESKEGSSFESASSAHSLAKEDTIQVVPSSPPTIAEETVEEITDGERIRKLIEDKKPETGRSIIEEREEISGDAESSSSGSYSLDSGQREPKVEWTDQDRIRMKKDFKLDLSDHSNEAENWSDGKEVAEKAEEVSPRQQHQTKGKYASVPVGKKAQQPSGKKWATKGNGDITPKMVRSPAMPEGFLIEDWTPLQKSSPSHLSDEVHAPKNESEVSSDESSCECKFTGTEETINSHSPRRHRRRGGGGRGRRNQGVSEQSSRRRPLASVLPSNQQQQFNPPSTKYTRSPGHSPRGSPRKAGKILKGQDQKKHNVENQETGGNLKTLSAESLRSVSPGSDSVFYNEGETHLLCRQCGREFEGDITRMEIEENAEEIVQPPAGFADSPENTRVKPHRLYKKLDKRFRSEERGGERRRHCRMKAEGLRAKSEERGREKGFRSKLRPHARSTDASLERLKAADSSPSISETLTSEEPKVYAGSFKKARWIRVMEEEESPGWIRTIDRDHEFPVREITDSTSSEKDFKRKYQAATHRIVHRKSTIEMYRQMESRSFGYEIEGEGSLRRRLEDVLQMMLVVWSTQEKALRVINDECNKKIVVKRQSGEFGFRIHGSRPVVVSAIEPDTPAETSGLEVGDIVLTVNGISVLEASHSDVVKLAHSGSDTLELEIASTTNALVPLPLNEAFIQFAGFLRKRSMNGKWIYRWFALRNDNCLYYFKSQKDPHPLGALMLFHYKFKFTPESGRPYSFIIHKEGAKSLELSADTEECVYKWKAYLEKAMDASPKSEGQWFEMSCRLLRQPPSSVPEPDCFGHLTQLEDKWRRRYCVLKDGALLIYADSSAPRALAVVCLQGCRVQNSIVPGKMYSFEIIPPESKQKHFYFYTDTEMDRKRWIAAVECCIDRWMRID